MTDNAQNLPPGIGERATAAQQQHVAPQYQPQYQPPSQVPDPYGNQPYPYQQPEPQQPAPQAPPVSPMLSRFSQQDLDQQAAAPQPPTQHLQDPNQQPQQPPASAPPKPEPSQNPQVVQDLLGDLSDDPYAKPSITYIENVCGSDVDLSRAFSKAVEHGDVGLIDQAYLREKLGDKADAVIQQAASLFEYSTYKVEQSLQEMYRAVGGEDVLKQAAKHFNEAADPAEKAEIEYLLNSGNKDLMQRAAQRIVQYSQSAGMVYKPGQQPLGNPGAVKGLSREAYLEEISKPNLSPERYDELRKQRQLGKQQGI